MCMLDSIVPKIILYLTIGKKTQLTYTHQKSLATFNGKIVDPAITAKREMQDVL